MRSMMGVGFGSDLIRYCSIIENIPMLHSGNSPIIPNRILRDHDEMDQRAKRKPVPFRDLSNRRVRQRQTGLSISSPPQVQDEENFQEEAADGIHDTKPVLASRQKMIVEFEDSSEEDPACQQLKENSGKSINPNTQEQMQTHSFLPHRSPLLLNLDDSDDQEEESVEQALKLKEKSDEFTPEQNMVFSELKRGQLVLSLDEDESVESGRESESEESEGAYSGNLTEKRKVLSLGRLMNEEGHLYFKKPVPTGRVLRCIVKREKGEDQKSTRYFFYDSATFRNIISVVKDEDGYSVISRYESESLKNLNDPRKQRVIAKITSNFFGTEFNCFQTNLATNKHHKYEVDTNSCPQLCCIQYQMNFFGLTGPRKMVAYLPHNETFTSKKRLNQMHDKGQKGVQKYRNKCPTWCEDIDAYVLNFHGRASISSVKNFIMVRADEDDSCPPRLLFGKFAKQLFNLDIHYPFSLVQAVALVISSFDKKLACQ